MVGTQIHIYQTLVIEEWPAQDSEYTQRQVTLFYNEREVTSLPTCTEQLTISSRHIKLYQTEWHKTDVTEKAPMMRDPVIVITHEDGSMVR